MAQTRVAKNEFYSEKGSRPDANLNQLRLSYPALWCAMQITRYSCITRAPLTHFTDTEQTWPKAKSTKLR
jgi:hypothetical protein